jgi:acyl-CoA synthetase (AMP-forming)/AMP-acid ligase II/acyl carrier protein
MGLFTIHEIMKANAESAPEGIAILGLADNPLRYHRLYEHILLTISQLNELGIGRNDRVAIVLPNGPQLAVAFLSISCATACAPLNPAYTSAEFDFYLSDLEAKALVVQFGRQSPVIEVARTRGIPILELNPLGGAPDGLFTLIGERRPPPGLSGPAQMSDVALILHTSGTTSHPKMVPLTHKNLCTSGENIRKTLELSEDDRCLNIMPLFHIHGLVAGVLASMRAGGSVVCTPGFIAPKFFDWLEIYEPTWYTAVPTMHQAILARAARSKDLVKTHPLRFIRSSSSSLPPSVLQNLEKTFKVPVVEAYGMTEASHQIASNPLPPASTKNGSVGLAAGPEISIMAEDHGTFMPAGALGEIVIRGASVTLGYAHNPEANSRSFTDGWFRTGDQGFIDNDGYLFITGRFKEIINRGGEKISPREIDDVFLEHPAVAQAVTFGMPDTMLGEDVAIAIVLKDPAVSERDLQKYAATRLAYHKVPRRVIILDAIPKGATGKIQRIGMAKKLGIVEESQIGSGPAAKFEAPRTQLEKILAEIWHDALNMPIVGVHDRFIDLGGDSMLATVVHMLIEEKFNIKLPLVDLFSAATIEDQGVLVAGLLPK